MKDFIFLIFYCRYIIFKRFITNWLVFYRCRFSWYSREWVKIYLVNIFVVRCNLEIRLFLRFKKLNRHRIFLYFLSFVSHWIYLFLPYIDYLLLHTILNLNDGSVFLYNHRSLVQQKWICFQINSHLTSFLLILPLCLSPVYVFQWVKNRLIKWSDRMYVRFFNLQC